jgi:hypothetical protein
MVLLSNLGAHSAVGAVAGVKISTLLAASFTFASPCAQQNPCKFAVDAILMPLTLVADPGRRLLNQGVSEVQMRFTLCRYFSYGNPDSEPLANCQSVIDVHTYLSTTTTTVTRFETTGLGFGSWKLENVTFGDMKLIVEAYSPVVWFVPSQLPNNMFTGSVRPGNAFVRPPCHVQLINVPVPYNTCRDDAVWQPLSFWPGIQVNGTVQTEFASVSASQTSNPATLATSVSPVAGRTDGSHGTTHTGTPQSAHIDTSNTDAAAAPFPQTPSGLAVIIIFSAVATASVVTALMMTIQRQRRQQLSASHAPTVTAVSPISPVSHFVNVAEVMERT